MYSITCRRCVTAITQRPRGEEWSTAHKSSRSTAHNTDGPQMDDTHTPRGPSAQGNGMLQPGRALTTVHLVRRTRHRRTMPCDPTHTRSLEESRSQTQSSVGAGAGGKLTVSWGQSFSQGRWKSSGNGGWWRELHNNMRTQDCTLTNG